MLILSSKSSYCRLPLYACGLSLAMAVAAPSAQGQGLFQKVVGKVAKVSGKVMGGAVGMTGSSKDLESIIPFVYFRTNLYPKEVGALEIDFFGKGWKKGNDAIQVQFVKKHGIKMIKLEDGSVTIDGKPASFHDFGVYTSMSEHSDAPRKVEITAGNGQKSSFTITPDKAIVLKSINGQTGDKVNIDITKDVTLELENPGTAENGATIQITMAFSKVGLKTFYEVGYFKPGKTIVIPAATFAHIQVPSNDWAGVSFNNAFLQVARVSYKYATDCQGQYKSIPYMVGAIDGRFIDIGPKPNFSKGLTVEADVKGTDVKYKFEKPVAVASRPFSHAKTVGVATFGVRGTSSVEKKEGSRMAGNETEYTATFNPSNELLDAISAKMYPEIVSITESVLGVKVVPIETVAATRAWKESGFMSETADGTATSFAKPYKSDKILSDAAIKIDGFRLVTDAKSIIQEAGVNSLLRCVIDLELDIENGKTKLTPTLKYTLYGETNGLGYFPTIYVEGEIRGKETKVNKKTTEAEILEIVNPAAMATALRAALTDLKEKEKANGEYELIWSKQ